MYFSLFLLILPIWFMNYLEVWFPVVEIFLFCVFVTISSLIPCGKIAYSVIAILLNLLRFVLGPICFDAFELWCWRRLLWVPWTAGRSNQSILKEISPEYSVEGLMLKLQYFWLPDA